MCYQGAPPTQEDKVVQRRLHTRQSFKMASLSCGTLGRRCSRQPSGVESLGRTWGKCWRRLRPLCEHEVILANTLALTEALQRSRAEDPTDVRGFSELVLRYQLGAELRGHDKDDTLEPTSLLGSGSRPTGSQAQDLGAALDVFMRELSPGGGWDDILENARASDLNPLLFKHAHVRGEEILHSRDYSATRSRESFWALASFHEPSDDAELDVRTTLSRTWQRFSTLSSCIHPCPSVTTTTTTTRHHFGWQCASYTGPRLWMRVALA